MKNPSLKTSFRNQKFTETKQKSPLDIQFEKAKKNEHAFSKKYPCVMV